MASHPTLRALPILALALSCRATFPAPGPREVASLRASPSPLGDASTARAHVRELERVCRAPLGAETVRASLAAIDRIRVALGGVCDLESVGDDPLHWVFRCRSDAFFDLGRYAFSGAARTTCEGLPSLRGAAVNRWVCAGALLEGLLGREQALSGAEFAVVGHVDRVRFAHEFDPCPELRRALGYEPSPPWSPVTAEATEEQRSAANDQLAWCRAAQVALQLRCGLALSRSAPTAPRQGEELCANFPEAPSDPGRALRLTVAGAGTHWQQAQPPEACGTPPDVASIYPGYCAPARRVDVFVKLLPSRRPERSTCRHQGTDDAGALYCLQECLEDAAAPSQGSEPTNVPLHVSCDRAGPALAPGWYRFPEPRATSRACTTLDLGLVRRELGMDRPPPAQ